jgi:putative methionine-R-sulfoxide reductase with GAF domain
MQGEPMPRGEKPAEANSAELAAARKSLRNEASRRRELEQRLAESLERERATGAILQEKDRALTEALEQQTATSEILRVISSSPTDLQPVLNTVVESAARFCGAYDASLYRLEGAALKLVAHHGPIHVPSGMLVPVVRGTAGGRSVLERRAIHVADLQAETEEYPEGSALARDFGHHTALAVPLLREGEVIGGIQLRRAEMSPFSDKQIAMLQTFADQAVIAIENVRLFRELEARNRDLSATSEVLQIISRSPTDEKPVFDAIAQSSMQLCGAMFAMVASFDGELLHLVSTAHVRTAGLEGLATVYPLRPNRGQVAGRAILERGVVQSVVNISPLPRRSVPCVGVRPPDVICHSQTPPLQEPPRSRCHSVGAAAPQHSGPRGPAVSSPSRSSGPRAIRPALGSWALPQAPARTDLAHRSSALPHRLVSAVPPDLIPVELLWSYLKYGRLANFAPDTTKDIQTAVNHERRRVARHPELLRSFFRHSALPFRV